MLPDRTLFLQLCGAAHRFILHHFRINWTFKLMQWLAWGLVVSRSGGYRTAKASKNVLLTQNVLLLALLIQLQTYLAKRNLWFWLVWITSPTGSLNDPVNWVTHQISQTQWPRSILAKMWPTGSLTQWVSDPVPSLARIVACVKLYGGACIPCWPFGISKPKIIDFLLDF